MAADAQIPDRNLKGSDKTLSAAACGALIDMMLEVRVVRLGLDTGKTHFRAAFHTYRIDAQLLETALSLCIGFGGHHVMPYLGV